MDSVKAGAFEDEFRKGRCWDCYRYMGNHAGDPESGETSFAVWAPHADEIRVVGDFNAWGARDVPGDRMRKGAGGIWHTALQGVHAGDLYKYRIRHADGSVKLKTDPMALRAELRPGTASIVWEMPDYPWRDVAWLVARANADYPHQPINIYEIHAGSWRRGRIPGIDYTVNWRESERRRKEEPFYTYRELADLLATYLPDMHYTHVELMPLCEHPLDDSWGYQTGSYYAVTSRYGTPEDFCYFVNRLHEAGIGVILDWVPGHFCKDDSWLYRFDGTWQYEYAAENYRENPLWGTANFDLSKGEVRSFLYSSAMLWLREYHVDGLRIDAAANLLYLDYDGLHAQAPRNRYGGNENLDGIDFLRELNRNVHRLVRRPLMIAEDSSTWPMVTRPIYLGGLGFDFKWNMGWMNDTLEYMHTEPAGRREVHNKMTFSLVYAFSENYVLPLSHDEMVHGKQTLLGKMAGSYEEKFAFLRAYLLYMTAHPGKKLLFMGSEFGQFMEWRFDEALEWKMLLYPPHGQLKEFVQTLNFLYKREPALYKRDDSPDGFRWIDANNAQQHVFSFIRYADAEDFLIIVCNMGTTAYEAYTVGVPYFTEYTEEINSDDVRFGGRGTVNEGRLCAQAQSWNGQPFSLTLKLPAAGALILRPVIVRSDEHGA